MGWFGSGKKEETPQENTYVSTDEGFSSGDGLDSVNGMENQVAMAAATGGGAAGLVQIQQQIQQQMLVETVVNKLTEMSVDKCISKPETSLSGREVSCIHSQVGKW
eukprot:CAMPEP_0113312748 /NCGR_PEP_ID=MMETSP0010_2-20120614/9457_1 /TAXON_ID=216773 ORGANISM="Corethron hystrix, Strain 308" /NCGR_SAMPLE_ID=MMETSP0010_2 /ASSEMBLY_ACC=CAM_ASM_000155 /LENGTH=105 /DNA_ID=CAMNT_0000168641 /DNA_START=105 /DNA_END=419 /DNA_ORIENTATION=+ /assembly_acc=CAM_ASM_000155